MLYTTAEDWLTATHKSVLLFGMSGLGKTYLSNMLSAGGEWFHYSIDYRIGTRYLGEYIGDSLKSEAMRVPYLQKLLLSNSIYIGSNITFNNLAPLSTFLGKPGAPQLGGLPFDTYMYRQDLHRAAETSALQDTGYFIDRAQRVYGYRNFVCDSSGSICEVATPEDSQDPVLTKLSAQCLLVWIEGSEAHTASLIERFDRAPKPMCYQPEFLRGCWASFQYETGLMPDAIEPDAFVRWVYAKALAHRQPRYRAMSRWGVKINADEAAEISEPAAFEAAIARALERRA